MSIDIVGQPIVAGVDGVHLCVARRRWAANEAARRRVPLRLVHGVKVSALSAAAYIDGLPPTDFFDALESDGHRYLAEAKAAVRQAHPGLEVDVELRSGNPVRD